MSEHSPNGRVVEAAAVVEDFYQQGVAAISVHDQRIVGLAANAELAGGPLAALPAQNVVPGWVLKIEDALKKRLAARHVTPTVDAHQRRVLEGSEGNPGVSQLGKPGQQPLLWIDTNADGHGVDEKYED